MFREPYDTSLLRGFPTKKLVEQLEVHFIDDALKPLAFAGDDEALVNAVYEIDPGVHGIDPMLSCKLIETRHGPKVVIDSRATKRESRAGGAVVTNPSDYRFAVRQAMLTYLWAVEGPKHFSQLGILPMRVYARWVSEGIVRRLGLDPMDQLRIQILAAYYYMCQFVEEEVPETNRYGMANLIARALSTTAETVIKYIVPVGPLTGLGSLVEAIKSGEGASPRLEMLNVGIIYTLLAGGWFGAHGRYIVATALEYPPTFLVMLLTAYTDRSYHSAMFTKTALSADKQSLSRDFTIGMNHLTRGFADV